MTKKSYADERLEWINRLETDRDKYQNMYLETARRLKRACETINEATHYIDNCLYDIEYFQRIVKELEAPLEDKK